MLSQTKSARLPLHRTHPNLSDRRAETDPSTLLATLWSDGRTANTNRPKLPQTDSALGVTGRFCKDKRRELALEDKTNSRVHLHLEAETMRVPIWTS